MLLRDDAVFLLLQEGFNLQNVQIEHVNVAA